MIDCKTKRFQLGEFGDLPTESARPIHDKISYIGCN